MLIQHGSCQWIADENQPNIEFGQVLLYRGIQENAAFRCLQFRPEELSPANRDIFRKYLGVQAAMLSDSVLSFNTIHDRVNRCETEGLRHATWLGDEMATAAESGYFSSVIAGPKNSSPKKAKISFPGVCPSVHPKKHAFASSDTSDANSSTDFTSGLGS